MDDFCLYVNISYFSTLFYNMRFSEEYTSACYRIFNKHSVVDRTLGEHHVIDLTGS